MVKKVWWDPGHGGSDPGAVGNGLNEKDLTLKIVRYAMTSLEANYTGFEQRATRTTDATVELTKRDDGPDAWGADVFVAVHINSGGGTGFESYVYTSPDAGSVSLQNVLHPEILAAMKKFGAITDRGKKRSNFFVVRETNAPSILTENLFVDSSDANYLKNEAFLKAIGEAHARGVAAYLGLSKKEVTPVLEQTPVRVIIPNSAFWQVKSLIPQYMDRGYKAYGEPQLDYSTAYPKDNDPWAFIIETTLAFANQLVNEFKRMGYDRVYIENR
ncbi:N-acetylmuramoyl-L-alanine amidase [Neobacillus dielmonensis]|uniref:N-acetylmuramoyl-L-alanine amidase n=1 Tax=Neobacillus dielmonensis TaxID=1347369 RepID=UPI0006932A34|nr:N-acetylmuramoyl-L-alanine amidase [Neobacillus dielmonensis]